MLYTILLFVFVAFIMTFMGEGRKRAFVTRLSKGLIRYMPQISFFIFGLMLVDWSIHAVEHLGWITPAKTEQSPKSLDDWKEPSSDEEEEDDSLMEDEEEEESPPVRAYT